MSNYDPQDNAQTDRSQPRDTSKLPASPVKDVFGQETTFGGPDPFQDLTEDDMVIREFTQQVQDKFKNIWKSTFKKD